ncbi:helix-turn-helix transcriptional regulator [Streptomyces sp. CB03911]|uniref:helix-turn-helix domain-containing protein n=1 Tax=Streptomyces sp. CB03911 TaxID=1804758 RepID=UPI00093F4E4B|nr:helix-turn-helix transcriptional regulator [Streptomyces sp. CB03911]OKI16594.1 hypothetical protein A6A07_11340 [Streptomyces sp. CB03911]
MDSNLATLLGIDPTDPRTVQAAEDAEAQVTLIETLVARRQAAGLTHQAVAGTMETTAAAVADFERLGGDPRLSAIMRYARALDVKVSVTVDEDPR